MSGTIGILNVGAGDTKLTFDPKNPSEVARTSRIVKDMLRRGYALLIEIGKDEKGEPKYARAKDFDEKHCEYIHASNRGRIKIAILKAQHEKETA